MTMRSNTMKTKEEFFDKKTEVVYKSVYTYIGLVLSLFFLALIEIIHERLVGRSWDWIMHGGPVLFAFSLIIIVPIYFIFGRNNYVSFSANGLRISRCAKKDGKKRLTVDIAWTDITKVDTDNKLLTTSDGATYGISGAYWKKENLWNGAFKDELWLRIEYYGRKYGSLK